MHRIKSMKDKLIKEAQNRMDNLDGGSIEQMGQIIDMIKDLSEAEKSCLEAEYYDTVIDAMDGESDRYGYPGQGGSGSGRGGSGGGGRSGGRSGYRDPYMMDEDGEGGRMGYRNQYGNFPANPKNRRRRMRRSGYSEESIENLRQMMEDADPERKRQLKQDLEELMQEM